MGRKPRFDESALRRKAGERTFRRGQDYASPSQVSLLDITAERVLARVFGTQTYTAWLVGGGTDFAGSCSCPANRDYGFCKHLVAVALVVNAGTHGAPDDLPLPTIRRHLATLPAEHLIDIIIDQASRDSALLEALERDAFALSGDDETTIATARELIARAFSLPDDDEYDGWLDEEWWFDATETSIDLIRRVMDGGRTDLALTLIDHARDCLLAAAADSYDSIVADPMLDDLAELRDAVWAAMKLEPEALAAALFERERLGDESFDVACDSRAEALGDAGLAEYLRLAEAAWAGPEEDFPDRARLARILSHLYLNQGNFDAFLALRKGEELSAFDYRTLCEAYLEFGHPEDALKWADEGAWLHTDGYDASALFELSLTALDALGRTDEVAERLWAAFDKRPSAALYARLRQIGATARCEDAIVRFKADLASGKAVTPFGGHAADTLVALLVEENRIEEAWAIVDDFGASPPRRDSLVAASHQTHPQRALAHYAARVEDLVEGGRGGYETAAAMVAAMATLRPAEEQAAYVADLLARHKRRRVFTALLR